MTRGFYASGARWRKNANCNGSISANRVQKPLPRKCPDLILISATGGDSALALYDQLSTIANGNHQLRRQKLAVAVNAAAKLPGMRNKRQSGLHRLISNWQRRRANQITAAAGHCLVYTAAARANLWTPESAQGQMLEQLGFTLAKLPAGLNASQSRGKRHDIIPAWWRKSGCRVKWRVTILFAGDQKDADAIYANRCSRTCLQYKTSRFMHWEPRHSARITTAPCKCWNDLRRCFKH